VSYRFLTHRRRPEFRLVVREDRPFPEEGRAGDWTQGRVREPGDVNEQVRGAVERTGYCLFRIGLSFADIPE
jgi:hypothetical protein